MTKNDEISPGEAKEVGLLMYFLGTAMLLLAVNMKGGDWFMLFGMVVAVAMLMIGFCLRWQVIKEEENAGNKTKPKVSGKDG